MGDQIGSKEKAIGSDFDSNFNATAYLDFFWYQPIH